MKKNGLNQLNKTSSHRFFIYSQITAVIYVFLICLSGNTRASQPDKLYFRIAHGASSDSNELSVSSLGVLSLKNNMVGHVDLSYLDSEIDGKASTLDFGAGFAFNWYVSPYLSVGASLGYNWDKNETIAAYYPEIGVVMDFTKSFGITFSGRRYYSLYEEEINTFMLGLVFRK